MQQTWHIMDFYRHKIQGALRLPAYRGLAEFTQKHDAYLIEHDRSVSAFVSAQIRS